MRQAITSGIAAVFGLVLWLASAAAQAGGDPRVDALQRALDLVEAEDWDGATAAASASGDAIVADIVEWHRLRAGKGEVGDYLAFLARRGDWPGLPYLRRKGEVALETAPADEVLRFFAYGPPPTAVGALAHARALRSLGRPDEAVASARRAFLRFPMDADVEAAIRREFPTAVRGRDWARLDAMLWKGARADAERLLGRVSPGQAALARARIMLRAGERGVDAAIEAVPASLRDDPGLAFERFRWRVKKGRGRAAEEILRARSATADALGRPAAWAPYRRRLAHEAMRAGRWNAAYEMASAHHLTEGSAFAELEWLAGYVALRGQRRPGVAAEHFARFRRAVATPISLGRGGYWLGRAWEAMGDDERARHFYTEGARHQTSFYGQLAAERAGVPPDPRLAGNEVFESWRTAPFLRSSVLQAALLLRAAGDTDLSARFFAHLSESLERDEIGRLLSMILDLGEPYAAVIVGKRAARAGHELVPGYFPLTRLTEVPLSVPPELALAIARRESEFRHQRISPAGA
ncbi:MAG: lytic transglycosylase domain-containing protein, partial [Alphaproteobacteria bacterium]